MGTFVTRSDEALGILATRVEATCIKYAKLWLQSAQNRIAANEYHKGLALGAGEDEMDLIASGYIATRHKNGFEEAKDAASFGRDAARGLWADPVVVPVAPDRVSVMIAFALSRATLMHEGYTDYREKVGYMFGDPFLYDTANDHADAFFAEIGEDMAAMEVVRVPTAKEVQRAIEEKYFQQQAAKEARAVAANERDLFDQFLASYGKDVLKRQINGRQTGVRPERVARPGLARTAGGRVRYENTGRLVPVYQRETPAERDERVQNLYDEWMRARNDRSGGF